jgi:hypothetical protein
MGATAADRIRYIEERLTRCSLIRRLPSYRSGNRRIVVHSTRKEHPYEPGP